MSLKMATLQKEALASCSMRGHSMGEFENYNPKVSYSECKVCGKWVQVETHPAPNSIEIGGPAVALNCTSTVAAGG